MRIALHCLFASALIGTLPLTAQVHAQTTASPTIEKRAYHIPPGPLGAVLSRYAATAGIILSFDPALTQGKHSPGIQQSVTVPEGLRQLLDGQGLEATRDDKGIYQLRVVHNSAAATTTLPAVNVSAIQENPEGAVNGYVARRSMTGTKTDTPLIETPQSISVIGRQELEDKGIVTLTEALQYTPGISVNSFGFDSRALDWINLRGFDGWYSSSYRDGLMQNVGAAFLGVNTEVYGLERIEVLRGPSSVLFGKGDVGGVVNRVSKLPSSDPVREIVAQVGSFDRRQLAADVGGSLNADNTLLYRIVGLALDSGTQEKYPNGVKMDQQRNYLAPSLRWQPSARTSVVLQAEYLRDDAADDVQFVTDINGQPTSIKEGDPNYSRIKTGTDAIGYQFEHLLDSGWSVRQKARYAHRTSDKHHIYSWLNASGTTLNRQARYDREEMDDFAIDTSLSGSLRQGNIEHKLLVGLDYSRADLDQRHWRNMAPSLSMTNPVYGIYIPSPTTQTQNNQIDSTQWGLYAQDQISFNQHWKLTAGLRQDRVTTDIFNRLDGTTQTQKDDATSGRLGLNYLAGNGWAPYISYATSFIPNTGIDATTGNAFKPSKGKQTEIGIKYMPENIPFSFAAALFDLEKDNVTMWDDNVGATRQIGKIRSRGLELEAKAELGKQWKITASLTALDLKILNSVNSAEIGKTPMLMPENTASVWLDYKFANSGWQGMSVGSGMRYVGKRWDDSTNTASQPSYTVIDAAARYETGPWLFALNVSNLFDRRYYAGHAYGSYYRGAERNVILTTRYRF